MGARLEIEGLTLAFGGVRVLQDISFVVEAGQVFGLVGPNGAGKTSLFNCMSGHYRPTSGSVRLDDKELLNAPAWRVSRLGLARTFQHAALRPEATVLENVMLGGHTRLRGGPLSWALRLPRTKADERKVRTEALELLDRLGMGWAADRKASELSLGLHKGVELCRALMQEPTLLLLDEPAAGLPHSEVENLINLVREVNTEFGVTVVVVEHNMGLISAVSERVIVLNHGRKLMEGTPKEAQSDPRVIEAYIGSGVSNGAA